MAFPPALACFDSITVGDAGNSLFAAAVLSLRRRSGPATARCTLARSVELLAIPTHQLRAQVALRVAHVAHFVEDLWEFAAADLGSPRMEAGAIPSGLQEYLEALHRVRRWADSFQLLALADVLEARLFLFVPGSRRASDGYPIWQLRWTAVPHNSSLEPLACQRPPLCLGVAAGRVWALEPGASTLGCPVRGSLDDPVDLLRLHRALPTCSSPSPTALSLAAEDEARRDCDSDSSYDGGWAACACRDDQPMDDSPRHDPDAALQTRAAAHTAGDVDQEQADEEEAWLRREVDEVARHVALRAWAASYCDRARIASALLGRLP